MSLIYWFCYFSACLTTICFNLSPHRKKEVYTMRWEEIGWVIFIYKWSEQNIFGSSTAGPCLTQHWCPKIYHAKEILQKWLFLCSELRLELLQKNTIGNIISWADRFLASQWYSLLFNIHLYMIWHYNWHCNCINRGPPVVVKVFCLVALVLIGFSPNCNDSSTYFIRD